MKTITATFTGANGSLGYETNKKYKLELTHDTMRYVTINRIDGGGRCDYSNVETFLDNWDNIKVKL